MSIFLGSTESLSIVIDAAPATNQLPCSASYVDQGGLGGDNSVNTNGTTPVVLVGSPASGVERLISQISILNADTATRIITVSKGSFRVGKFTVLAGNQLFYDGGWKVLDASGNFLCNVTVTGGTLTANQGTAAAITAPWPVELSNGTNAVGTASAPLRTDPTGTTTQPVSVTGTPAFNLTQVDSIALGAPVAYGSTPTGNAISVNAFVTNGGSGGASNITQWDSVALGSPSAYGTSPGAVSVIGTNAFITNTVTVNDTTGNLAQASTTSGQLGTLAQGAATTAAPTYVTGKTNPLSLNLAGGLRVDGSGVTQPVSGTVTTTPPSNASTNLTQLAGSTLGAPSNYGTSPGAVEVQGVNAFVTNPVAVTGTFFQTTQPVSGTVTANQGTSPWVVSLASTTITGTVAATQSGTWTVQPGNTANTTPWLVTANAGTGNFSTNNSQWGGVATSLGQKVSASSVPMVIASDQSTLGVQGLGTEVASATLSTTTAANLTTAARTTIRSVNVTSVGAVLAAGSTFLQIKDGGGTIVMTINCPTATATATSPFIFVDHQMINVPMVNGANRSTASLTSALTSGSIYVTVTSN